MMSHAHAFDWRTTAAARDRRLNEGTQHAGGDENAAAATNRSSGATAAPGRGHTDLAAKKHDTKQLVVETPRQQPATAKQGAKTFALWIPEEQEFRKQLQTLSIYDWDREKTPQRRTLYRHARTFLRVPALPPRLSSTPTVAALAGVHATVWHRTVHTLISTQHCDPLYTLSVGVVYYQRLLRHALDAAAAVAAVAGAGAAIPAPGSPMSDEDPLPVADAAPGKRGRAAAVVGSSSASAGAWSANTSPQTPLLVLELTAGTAPRMAAAAAGGPDKLAAYFHYAGGGATNSNLHMGSTNVGSNGFCAAVVRRQQELGAAAVDITAPRRVHVLSPDGRNLMFMAANVIAMKMSDDLHLANRYMSHFYDVPLATVNAAELTALKLLRFALAVPAAEQRLVKGQLARAMEVFPQQPQAQTRA